MQAALSRGVHARWVPVVLRGMLIQRATAGDLLARDLVCDWLGEAEVAVA